MSISMKIEQMKLFAKLFFLATLLSEATEPGPSLESLEWLLAIDVHMVRFQCHFNPTKTLTNPVTKSKSTHGARPTCLSSRSTSQVEGVSPSEPCAQRRPKRRQHMTTFPTHPPRLLRALLQDRCLVASPGSGQQTRVVSQPADNPQTVEGRERRPPVDGCPSAQALTSPCPEPAHLLPRIHQLRGTCALPHSPRHIPSVPEPQTEHMTRGGGQTSPATPAHVQGGSVMRRGESS